MPKDMPALLIPASGIDLVHALINAPVNIGVRQPLLCDSHICLFQLRRSRVARIPRLRNLLGRTPLHRPCNRLRYDRRRKRRGQ
jgi:hypothetical protein